MKNRTLFCVIRCVPITYIHGRQQRKNYNLQSIAYITFVVYYFKKQIIIDFNTESLLTDILETWKLLMSLSGHKGSPAIFAWGILCRVTGLSKTSRIDTGEPVRFFMQLIQATAGIMIIGFFVLWFFPWLPF